MLKQLSRFLAVIWVSLLSQVNVCASVCLSFFDRRKRLFDFACCCPPRVPPAKIDLEITPRMICATCQKCQVNKTNRNGTDMFELFGYSLLYVTSLLFIVVNVSTVVVA